MVISLDGHYVDDDYSSSALSSDVDLSVMRLLRAMSDVVVVGGLTVRQGHYAPRPIRPEFAELGFTSPRLAIVSRSLNFDLSSDIFRNPESRPLILTTHSQDPLWAPRFVRLSPVAEVVVSTEPISGSWIKDQLNQRNYRSILSEGGPIVQDLLRRDYVLNEMDVTVAPMIMGFNGLGSPFGAFRNSLSLSAVAQGGSHLFMRYLCLER